MKKSIFLLLLLLLPAISFPSPPEEKPLIGFTSNRSAEQKEIEKKFDVLLNRDDLRNWMKRFSAHPHHLGSAYDKSNAEYIDSLFTSWGFETSIEEFSVLFPTPKTRLLEMIEPQSYTALLSEPALNEDGTSRQQDEQLPVYNAYSIDGDVTGELVYVNYGVPKDYEELERNGMDVKGKIVIARYGGSWRGIKPKVAAEHGAIGCIIYSDPHEDGYFEGDVYPKGSYRNERGAQRGSVADMPIHPGDPLTPFVGATKNAKRLSLKEVKTLTKIPVLPISYTDALPLLRELSGPVAPEDWRGALPITYHLGPGSAKVHLKLEFNWNMAPVYDVIAKMKGNESPDQWVIRGNHSDAWVTGAEDPVSGLVCMLEEAKAIGSLAKTGWKPKRTIIYCAWDGEEQGLLGSTEWAEAHADVLKSNAVAYINSDSNGRGFLFAGGSHTLEKFVNEVAANVTDPEKNISVAERLRAYRSVEGSPESKKEIHQREDFRIYALGSGSDYTPFLQHLGIASLNLGYGGESGGGSYHSIYDSYDYYTRFIDPTFQYGVTLAQTAGRSVLRLANADLLPLEFGNFSETIGTYADEIIKLADNMRTETEETNSLLREQVFNKASDPTKTYIPPIVKESVPYLDFAPIQNALTILQRSAKQYEAVLEKADLASVSSSMRQSLNALLLKSERALTTDSGLPRRPWFVHQIYAPGFYTGYGVKTLPGIREAIEQRNWAEAEAQIVTVSKTLKNFSDQIDRASEMVKQFKNK